VIIVIDVTIREHARFVGRAEPQKCFDLGYLWGWAREDLIKNEVLKLGMVVDTCNPSYLAGRNRKIVISRQPGQKVAERLSQRTSCVWWAMPVIPAM
jgi:hypothetical protein